MRYINLRLTYLLTVQEESTLHRCRSVLKISRDVQVTVCLCGTGNGSLRFAAVLLSVLLLACQRLD